MLIEYIFVSNTNLHRPGYKVGYKTWKKTVVYSLLQWLVVLGRGKGFESGRLNTVLWCKTVLLFSFYMQKVDRNVQN